MRIDSLGVVCSNVKKISSSPSGTTRTSLPFQASKQTYRPLKTTERRPTCRYWFIEIFYRQETTLRFANR